MKKIIYAAFFLLFLLIAIGGTYALGRWLFFAPQNLSTGEKINLLIKSGDSLYNLAPELKAANLIRSVFAFKLYHWLFTSQIPLQAGTHILHSKMSLAQIYSELHQPPHEVTITILPGWRREEIAEYLSRQPLSAFSSDEFMSLTAGLEGKLMPDTYKIAPLSTAATVVNILSQQFAKAVLNNVEIQKGVANSHKSLDEIIIIASLLQREARDSEQMRMIAGIINNRLTANYPLQLCATAQYAVGKNPQTGSWWTPPSVLDTKVVSPYNTYLHPNLPPAPICAVSLDAIKAAYSPLESDYFYYLHDSAGQIHYGKTLEQHQANIDNYLK